MSLRQPVELPSHEILAQLARDDPQAYEALRRDVIERFIDSAPANMKARLRGIQFRVDYVRQLSRSELGATVRVYKLMWESFLSLNDGWQNLAHAKARHADTRESSSADAYVPARSAQLFEFRPRSSHAQDCAPASG